MGDCEFDPSVPPLQARGARAAYDSYSYSFSWYDTYYTYYSSYGYYPYWNPVYYYPSDFCGYWGWGSSCYSYFGYPSSYTGYYTSCSTCLYDPYGSSCYYYCTLPGNSYTYYPTTTTTTPSTPSTPSQPSQPVDPCKGVAGSYSGVCTSTAGSTALSFSVSAVNGACQLNSSNLIQSTYLTTSSGYGVASVTGIGVAISNSVVEVYGSNRFRLTGYNYAGNFYFTCH